MSGFIAIINTDGTHVDSGVLNTLTASLQHRGPDQQQVWMAGAVGFGHTLLRTTDEARYENQPATIDGKVWITGCIRVDARADLLQQLGLQGDLRLQDTPDSHLILYAYRAWGEQCLEHLLGDYAFALWDSELQKLFCARDRFGLRQLVYAQTRQAIIVSNSIFTILQHPSVSDRLCDAAIGDFLLFGDHRWGDRSQTAFADIQALEPAHCLVVKDSAVRTRRYWKIAADTPLLRYRTEAEYVEHFEQVFKTAVADRLRNSEIVISLSGGMDSSSIAAVIGDLRQERHTALTLHAVSVLFDSIHSSDERYYMMQVSRALQLAPHYIDGGRYSLLAPNAQTTSPQELYQPQLWLDLERHALTRGRVLLNGDGGDELLKSTSVRAALKDSNPIAVFMAVWRLRQLYTTTPSLGTGLMAAKKRIRGRAMDAHLPYPYPGWIHPDCERELQLQQRWSTYWSQWQFAAGASAVRHPHIATALLTPDWNTDDLYMQCGTTLLEQRSPFLDPRLVELVMAIPALHLLFNKHLLRQLMVDKLPVEVLKRPKTPLGTLHASLLKQNVLEKFRPEAATSQYIDRNWMEALPIDAGDTTESYINLRPLLLNTWLGGLRA